jgi:hypothetical protein
MRFCRALRKTRRRAGEQRRCRPFRSRRCIVRQFSVLTNQAAGVGAAPPRPMPVKSSPLSQGVFRNRRVGSTEEPGNWMHAFSEVLTRPPCVEILQ